MINRPLSDMESGGLYINKEDKIIPMEKREIEERDYEDDICHYSGLSSLSIYCKT